MDTVNIAVFRDMPVHRCCMWQVLQNKRCTKILGGQCRENVVYSRLKHLWTRSHRRILCSIFQYKDLFYGPPNTVCSSVLEKAPTKFLVAHLVRQRSYNVDELKTVTVSSHYELSLVTWHIEHVKQMHHFKKELFVKFGMSSFTSLVIQIIDIAHIEPV
jgi:hypothetical protein